MKIASIAPAGTADVYNMEVPGPHSFVVNGGIISHNCYDAFRYVAMAYPRSAVDPREVHPHKFNPYDDEEEVSGYYG